MKYSQVARLLGTVPCDLTCQIGRRVQRLYDAPVAAYIHSIMVT
jgi:hypothetical protein